MKTYKNNKTDKVGVFYRIHGKWAPIRTNATGKPRTFTSRKELNRFLNSTDFNLYRKYDLKSRVSVRKLTSSTV